MKKTKKILMLSAVGLLLVGCGHGSTITIEETKTKLAAMEEKVSADTFEFPSQIGINIEFDIKTPNSETKLKGDYKVAEYYLYVNFNTTEKEDENSETVKMEQWIYVEGNKLYTVMSDDEKKQYSEQEFSSEDEAKTTFDSISSSDMEINLESLYMTTMGIAVGSIVEYVDTAENLETYYEQNSINKDKSTFEIETRSKGEDHLYMKVESKEVSEKYSDETLMSSVTSEANLEIEIEDYRAELIKMSLNTDTVDNTTDPSKTTNTYMNLNLEFDYNFRVSKPNLKNFTKTEAN